MVKVLVFIVMLCSLSALSQLHNRLYKFNIGVSSEQIDFKNQIQLINDTSATDFELVSQSPIISISQEYILGDILSISSRVGFQYLNVFYDNQYYGSPLGFASVSPQLSLIYRKRFEYYVKLQLGVVYRFRQENVLPPYIGRFFPEKLSVFTGLTVGGFNYYLTDHLGLNLELTIWSPELLTLGMSYRFYKGELPSIQEMQGF